MRPPATTRARRRTQVQPRSYASNIPSRPGRSVIRAPEHSLAESRAAHQPGARNQALQVFLDILARRQLMFGSADRFAQAREVVGHLFRRDGVRDTLHDEVRGLV